MEGTTYMEDSRVPRPEDSEEEEEKKEEKENSFEIDYAFDEAALPSGASRVVISATGVSEALLRITLDLKEIGSIKVTEKEETKEVLKVAVCQNLLILQLTSDMKSGYCNQIMNKMWALLEAKSSLNLVVGIRSVYKTNYSTFQGSMQLDAGQTLPIKYIQTRAAKAHPELKAFLQKHSAQVSPDNQINFQGGLVASFLMEAEMLGKPAVSFKAIVDEHKVTSESMQAFTGIVNDLLGLSSVNMDEIFLMPKFRPVLKELNAVTHGIFS
uniref:Uncharacterized protein n=1 Tax=Strombidium inclinatum TaxID=197538 RepID=A0A7S3N2N3_9SPIT